jgi:hypothetical protein
VTAARGASGQYGDISGMSRAPGRDIPERRAVMNVKILYNAKILY